MSDFSALSPMNLQLAATAEELRKCNERTAFLGLTLTEAQIQSLVKRRFEALKNTGRVELGAGILKKLIEAFYDSPYLSPENYEDTLLELQDSFYYYKNESEDRISDDELIEFMRKTFDGKAQGSLEYLAGTSLDELCRNIRYGDSVDDVDGFRHIYRPY